MIKYVLGITVANNELPLDKGILVMNVQTVIASHKVTEGERIQDAIVEICSNRLMEKSSQIKIEEIDTVGIDCVLSKITI